MDKEEKVRQIAKALRAEDYRVVQYSPWHLRVFKDGMACDLWPTSRKLMLRDGFWSVKVYKKLMSELAAEFAGAVTAKTPTDAEKVSIQQYGDFRDQLTAKLQSMGLQQVVRPTIP